MQSVHDVTLLAKRPSPAARAASTSRKTPLRLEASWADSTEDLRRVQRLRHQVFAAEMGARLQRVAGTPPGHDADRFDDYCAHLLVRAIFPDEETHEVVGTYRVLTPDAARCAGGFYSETEFDLTPLAPIRSRMAELGRSCIHPAWRTGGTILALWSALGDFMRSHRLDLAFGCVSVGMGDGGHAAASLWQQLSALHLAPPERRVCPLRPLPIASLRHDVNVETPALIRGYLRCGAELLGPPAYDSDFNTADLPMLMSFAGLPRRHRRHFLGVEAD